MHDLMVYDLRSINYRYIPTTAAAAEESVLRWENIQKNDVICQTVDRNNEHFGSKVQL